MRLSASPLWGATVCAYRARVATVRPASSRQPADMPASQLVAPAATWLRLPAPALQPSLAAWFATAVQRGGGSADADIAGGPRATLWAAPGSPAALPVSPFWVVRPATTLAAVPGPTAPLRASVLLDLGVFFPDQADLYGPRIRTHAAARRPGHDPRHPLTAGAWWRQLRACAVQDVRKAAGAWRSGGTAAAAARVEPEGWVGTPPILALQFSEAPDAAFAPSLLRLGAAATPHSLYSLYELAAAEGARRDGPVDLDWSEEAPAVPAPLARPWRGPRVTGPLLAAGHSFTASVPPAPFVGWAAVLPRAATRAAEPTAYELDSQPQVRYTPGLATAWREHRAALRKYHDFGSMRQHRLTRFVAQLRSVAGFSLIRLLTFSLGRLSASSWLAGTESHPELVRRGRWAVNGQAVYSPLFQLYRGDVVAFTRDLRHGPMTRFPQAARRARDGRVLMYRHNLPPALRFAPTRDAPNYLEVDELTACFVVVYEPVSVKAYLEVLAPPAQLPFLSLRMYNWKYTT